MARRKQKTLVIFPDLLMGTKKLTNAQLGALMRGIFEYHFEGTEQEFDDPMVDMAFDFIKPQFLRYKQICEINRNNRANKDSNVTDTSSADNEVQRNATEYNETEGNPTHNHTHNHTHTHNRTHTHTHTHNQNQNQKKKESKKENFADKPPP